MESLIFLQLSKEEAVVLFELITRVNKNNQDILEDPAEQRILLDFESALENELAEALASDYQQILESAREHIRSQEK